MNKDIGLQLRRGHAIATITGLFCLAIYFATPSLRPEDANKDVAALRYYLPLDATVVPYARVLYQWDSLRAALESETDPTSDQTQDTDNILLNPTSFQIDEQDTTMRLTYARTAYDGSLETCAGWYSGFRRMYFDLRVDQLPSAILCRWIDEDALLYWQLDRYPPTTLITPDSAIDLDPADSATSNRFRPWILHGEQLDQCAGWWDIARIDYDHFTEHIDTIRPAGCHWIAEDSLLIGSPGRTIGPPQLLPLSNGDLPVFGMVTDTANLTQCAVADGYEGPPPPNTTSVTGGFGSTPVMCTWITPTSLVFATVVNDSNDGTSRIPAGGAPTVVLPPFEEMFPTFHRYMTAAAQRREVSVYRVPFEGTFIKDQQAYVVEVPLPNLFGIQVSTDMLDVLLGPWIVLVQLFLFAHLRKASQHDLDGFPWLGAYSDSLSRIAFALTLLINPIAVGILQGHIIELETYGLVIVVALALLPAVQLPRYWGGGGAWSGSGRAAE